ncbi:alpha/beta fold hydrolase [Pseudorhodobacter turbinis]|uniref:Alpha/beta fold hydrolase n=1 Tax=Pseudorhodobacter turbinis TaxID=2500533 RepID=A0A4V1E0L8_9RHOB|nr:alpha/beta fold hydrolase [Pseudorhodobacter turbinis]QCO55084.1 alpha/beta fold hydrolase [Pseudorhodobacter turbinis]
MTFSKLNDAGSLLRGLALLALIATAGCAQRPGPEALTPVHANEAALRQVTIKVATTRMFEPATGSYSDARAPALSYESFTVSIPPTHKATRIELPTTTPDPLTSFAVTERRKLPDLGLSTRAGGKHDIMIFVHGYNYSFAESLFRLAQVATDGELTETPVLFAWPSAATVVGYIADKDAATYSRDDLVALLTDVATDPNIGEITLFGHSMGGWLVAEALRQLRLSGQDKVIDRLANVVLAAPDIDLDVFHRQLRTIGPLTPPMTLLVSADDRALRLAEWLAGSRARLGTTDTNDPKVQSLAAAHGLLVIDISKVDALDPSNHNRFAGLMTVLPRAPSSTLASLRHAGAFILEPISATLVASQK